MISLEKTSGLPIEMRDDFSLAFGAGVAAVKAQVREFSSMKNYLKDPQAQFGRRDVYHIYRDVSLEADAERIRTAGVQYDLTVIPPGMIGDEFVKTIGHYHPYKPGTAVRYPEVYEVIHGQVFWILQRPSEDFERLEEVYLIRGGRGSKLVVPPSFGHVSVNPTDEVLVLSNWQPRGLEPLYESYETHNGAAYYVTRSERLSKTGSTSTNFEFVPNLSYKSVPELQPAESRELPQYNLRSALPIYFTGTKDLSTLDFLTNPEKYLDDLTVNKLLSPQVYEKFRY
jgi:glucose-6-phosphate isomerase